MEKVKYSKKNVISKSGVNYVRDVVEKNNSIFQEINQENDVGVDAIIEFVEDEIPSGRCVAVQIKSGKKYFNKKSRTCKIPIGNHYEYWKNHSMPMYGIVYVLQEQEAYFINIKRFLMRNSDIIETGEIKEIKFEINQLNRFNIENFYKMFRTNICGKLPDINLEESIKLFHSNNLEEFYTGYEKMFTDYNHEKIVWDKFVEFFQKSNLYEIPEKIVIYMSHLPGHPDLDWSPECVPDETRKYGITLLNKFNKMDIVKLLYFIDKYSMKEGLITRCIEAIISSVANVDCYLEEIIRDNNCEMEIREGASCILAYRDINKFVSIYKQMDKTNSTYMESLTCEILNNKYCDYPIFEWRTLNE